MILIASLTSNLKSSSNAENLLNSKKAFLPTWTEKRFSLIEESSPTKLSQEDEHHAHLFGHNFADVIKRRDDMTRAAVRFFTFVFCKSIREWHREWHRSQAPVWKYLKNIRFSRSLQTMLFGEDNWSRRKHRCGDRNRQKQDPSSLAQFLDRSIFPVFQLLCKSVERQIY